MLIIVYNIKKQNFKNSDSELYYLTAGVYSQYSIRCFSVISGPIYLRKKNPNTEITYSRQVLAWNDVVTFSLDRFTVNALVK